jgi:predicted DNA-binding protein with PD1-like motif
MTWFCRLLRSRAVLVAAIPCLLVVTTTHPAGAGSKRQRLVDRAPAGQPVPSPLAFATSVERIVIVRLTYGSDVLEGLARAVREERIESAVILSGIGSLKSYHVHAVSSVELPSTNVFFKGQGPYDLTAVNGYVVGGRVHAHVTFSNDKQALGGHLEPGTTTYTFVIVTLGVLPGTVDLTRLDDTEWR